MENTIPQPTTIECNDIDNEPSQGRIVVSPCFPGYGTTLGNALRRVLLSSLPGAAATAVKIKGVDHEFSTIDNVKEDVVEIILNIKSLRFRMHTDEPVELELSVKGEKEVKAEDFKKNSDVEIINADQIVATLTDSAAELSLKIIVEQGLGYVAVESRESVKLDVGYIAIDAVYTPVRNVNFKTEHVRVGQMTNFDKLLLDITTDATISPEEAFRVAAKILVDQFQVLTGEDMVVEGAEEEADDVEEVEAEKEKDTEDASTDENVE